MQFAFLGSGSRGNALLVEHNQTCLMLDNGFSTRETVARLGRLQQAPETIDAILVTHEHSDHIAGVGVYARRYQVPVWMTPGTYKAARHRLGDIAGLNFFDPDGSFSIQDLHITPIPLMHDARQPCQFVIGDGQYRFAVLTDTGSSSAEIESLISGCDALALECNHDRDMLQNSDYPRSLKQRVAGKMGHLDNDSAADILQSIDCDRLQHFVAVHLSEKNNMPTLVRDTLSAATGWPQETIQVASQDRVAPWRTMSHVF